MKQHTEGDSRWEAIQIANSRDPPLSLSHFRLLKRLGYGDIGSVYLVELTGTNTFFAMKVIDRPHLLVETNFSVHKLKGRFLAFWITPSCQLYTLIVRQTNIIAWSWSTAVVATSILSVRSSLISISVSKLHGMNQAGLAECIVRAVHACHPHLHPVLFESIILTGGSTLFPRFAERREMELRLLVRDDYRVKITTQEDPILGVWRGGSLLASSPDFESMCVTKAEYEELGSTRCRRQFFH